MSPIRRAAQAIAALTLGLALAISPNVAASTASAAPTPTTSAKATTKATAKPTATTSSASPSPTPSPSATLPPVKPADEDQWVRLAMVVGGGLIGAVVFFMIIGGILRFIRKRRDRRA